MAASKLTDICNFVGSRTGRLTDYSPLKIRSMSRAWLNQLPRHRPALLAKWFWLDCLRRVDPCMIVLAIRTRISCHRPGQPR
jgi:hypothetical protein